MSISSLRAELAAVRAEKKNYEKRRSKVQDAVSAFSSKLDDEVRDVNKKIDKCAQELDSAINGYALLWNVVNEINIQKESDPEYDGKMSQCISTLKSEVSRCDHKIQELEEKIEYIKYRIEVERERARRAREKRGD